MRVVFKFLRLVIYCIIFQIVIPTYTLGLELKRHYETNLSIKNLSKSYLQEYNDIIYTIVPRGVIISIKSCYIFSFNQNTINTNSDRLLKNLGNIINEIDKPCIIESHTTEEISQQYNLTSWELSIIRAGEIANYLSKTTQAPPEKIRHNGYGNLEPFCYKNKNKTENLNDRIDFVILNYEAGLKQ